ncbi:MAG: RnfABCDGE type electron transport complex subunit G [Dehalococcoidales bacterium]|nr:RnfABCDGE type electron transport complex subunit G [Dehalococcoidales bacterium]
MKARTLREFFPIIFITLVVFLAVALLSVTYSITKDEIKTQEELKIQRLLEEMFPEMSEYTLKNEVYTVYSKGDTVGYAFVATGKGYGGTIDILVGLKNETTVKGIKIISQQETPGLGNKILESDFTSNFTTLDINNIFLKRDGGSIDAITGATISSRAVTDAVRTTILEKLEALKESK